ncbi:hybrid sensor histidine kinase/response regulator [Spirulina subsalsa]|uniref:hybrid sensor histidine kinase/response regulator n=1 Tax=Spirulina subsalsa TaxID=54311 RepID=UPI0002E4ABE5
MNTSKVLVIDDEPDNFDVIETLLSNQDYELYYSASGEDAISVLPIMQPDLILLDVMMPVMNGIEVCKRIKAMPEWATTPIIMVTALSSKESLAECLAAGADDFMGKPINALELRARVHSMLRIKHQYNKIEKLYGVQNNTIHILQGTLEQLRGNLASSLSHELNTPLNGILGMISLVMDDLEDMDTAEIMEMLGLAHQSACRLEGLVKRFLIYLELELKTSQDKEGLGSVPESKKQPLDSSLLSLSFLEPIWKKYAQQSQRYDDFDVMIEPGSVAISERYLTIILNEVIENALKFSKPGTKITLHTKILDDKLILSIQDLGRGMTEEQINQIGAFIQFGRKHYEQQGMGLGLKIIQKITDLVGGKTEITSIHNQETRVNITLPLAPSSEPN